MATPNPNPTPRPDMKQVLRTTPAPIKDQVNTIVRTAVMGNAPVDQRSFNQKIQDEASNLKDNIYGSRVIPKSSTSIMNEAFNNVVRNNQGQESYGMAPITGQDLRNASYNYSNGISPYVQAGEKAKPKTPLYDASTYAQAGESAKGYKPIQNNAKPKLDMGYVTSQLSRAIGYAKDGNADKLALYRADAERLGYTDQFNEAMNKFYGTPNQTASSENNIPLAQGVPLNATNTNTNQGKPADVITPDTTTTTDKGKPDGQSSWMADMPDGMPNSDGTKWDKASGKFLTVDDWAKAHASTMGTPTKVTLADGTVSDAYINKDGQTILSNGQRIPAGARTVAGGKVWEMQADGTSKEVVASRSPQQIAEEQAASGATDTTQGGASDLQTFAEQQTAQAEKLKQDALDAQLKQSQTSRDFGIEQQKEAYKQAAKNLTNVDFMNQQHIGQTMANRGILNSGMLQSAMIQNQASMRQQMGNLSAKNMATINQYTQRHQDLVDKIAQQKSDIASGHETNLQSAYQKLLVNQKTLDSLDNNEKKLLLDAMNTSIKAMQKDYDISDIVAQSGGNPQTYFDLLSKSGNLKFNQEAIKRQKDTLIKVAEADSKIAKEGAQTSLAKTQSDVAKSKLTGTVWKDGKDTGVKTFDANVAIEKIKQKAADSEATKEYRSKVLSVKGKAQATKINNDKAKLDARENEFKLKAYQTSDKASADFLNKIVTATGTAYRNSVSNYNALLRTKPDGTFVSSDDERTVAANKVADAKVANEQALSNAIKSLSSGSVTAGQDAAYSAFFSE